MNVEECCSVFFDGSVKPKHLSSFVETTPRGNVIKGYINHKPNKYLGSLLITTVNNHECIQFVQSMPKIHYFEDDECISIDATCLCYEKLDGSCLILYPLKDSENNIIEIVPKTRNKAVADSHFIELYNHIDKKPILDYYEDNDGVLIFELYGLLNQHDVINYETGVDVRLICVVEYGMFINNPVRCLEYGFKLPDLMFIIYHQGTEWYIESVSEKYHNYLKNHKQSYPTIKDTINGLTQTLEQLNKKYMEINNRIATEGVVINTQEKDGAKKWIKCKPSNIKLKHQSENGIPKQKIRKEVLKYFDEYGSEVAEIYNNNPTHHTEYIHRMLNEEYPIEYINKSNAKIEKIFMQIWDNKQIPESIHTICNNLITEYPESNVSDLMRIFAKKYPMKKKKDGKLVFNVLEKKKKEGDDR